MNQANQNHFFQIGQTPREDVTRVEVKEMVEVLPAVVLDPYNYELKKGVKYSPEIGLAMYKYFASKQKNQIKKDTFVWKNGEVSEKERVVANPPPHFSEFARMIGVTWNKLKIWKKKHEEFSEIYDACIDIIQEFYIDNGVSGDYSSQFAIFAAKNTTKMRDRIDHHTVTVDIKKVLDMIEAGKDPNKEEDDNAYDI